MRLVHLNYGPSIRSHYVVVSTTTKSLRMNLGNVSVVISDHSNRAVTPACLHAHWLVQRPSIACGRQMWRSLTPPVPWVDRTTSTRLAAVTENGEQRSIRQIVLSGPTGQTRGRSYCATEVAANRRIHALRSRWSARGSGGMRSQCERM